MTAHDRASRPPSRCTGRCREPSSRDVPSSAWPSASTSVPARSCCPTRQTRQRFRVDKRKPRIRFRIREPTARHQPMHLTGRAGQQSCRLAYGGSMVERYRDRNVRAVRVKPCGIDVRHVAGQMAYGRSHAVQGRHGHSQQGSGIHWAYQIRKLISHGGPYAADRPKARERRRVMALWRSSDACRGKQTAHV